MVSPAARILSYLVYEVISIAAIHHLNKQLMPSGGRAGGEACLGYKRDEDNELSVWMRMMKREDGKGWWWEGEESGRVKGRREGARVVGWHLLACGKRDIHRCRGGSMK